MDLKKILGFNDFIAVKCIVEKRINYTNICIKHMLQPKNDILGSMFVCGENFNFYLNNFFFYSFVMKKF